jgi:hypothetical protein
MTTLPIDHEVVQDDNSHAQCQHTTTSTFSTLYPSTMNLTCLHGSWNYEEHLGGSQKAAKPIEHSNVQTNHDVTKQDTNQHV